MKKILDKCIKMIFSRMMITSLLILLQILWLFWSFDFLGKMSYVSMIFLSGILLIYIINQDETPEFKLVWMVPICVAPVFGALLYLFVKGNPGGLGLRKGLEKRLDETREFLETSPEVMEEVLREGGHLAGISRYLGSTGGFPTYFSEKNRYFSCGEDKFRDLLKELEQAEHFIFLEYFIVAEGVMWQKILDLLEQKAAEGVEVRFMYDGTCSLLLLPHSYPKKMEEKGIRTKVFSPIIPLLSTSQNSRDHRKILVIDGRVAYTGGINLADEYINEIVKFGHWKDAAVRIEGEAVRSFTLMFLQMWNIGEKGREDYERYLEKSTRGRRLNSGFVIPYGDGPAISEHVAETVYLDIIHQATEYVHIMTPYFIVNNAMLDALQFAARRGVEVKLLLPHVPDKKAVFAISRTYYPDLLSAGVEVYEYEPGFVHSKVFISDDRKAVAGTINMDYRSLYHHFECGCYFYGCGIIREMEKDFQKTLKKSLKADAEYYKNISVLYRLAGRILRIFAPLI